MSRASHRSEAFTAGRSTGCAPAPASTVRAGGAQRREHISSMCPVSERETWMHSVRALLAAVIVLAGAVWPGAVAAQVADRCFAVSRAPSMVQPASIRVASLSPAEVRLTFVGHATWLIESAGGVKIATDYNDYIRPPVVPDVATMNRAHTTHYSLVARSRHPACSARLEPGGWAGQARSDARRCARTQRGNQHTRLVRRRDRLRQFDLHFRGRGHVHRPSGPLAPHADRAAGCPRRATRCCHGGG